MNQLQALNQIESVTDKEEGVNQYLTFALGDNTYALKISRIREIIEYGTLTTVPMMPNFIRGVINLRGQVVPAVDLQARFDQQGNEPDKRTCIVIIEVGYEGNNYDIGVVVDVVNAVITIPDAEVAPPPAFGSKIRTDFIQGMGKVNGEFVVILDVAKVLSVDEMAKFVDAGDTANQPQTQIA